MFSIWDSLKVFWPLPRDLDPSPALPFIKHRACLLSWGRFYCYCYSWWSSPDTASPKYRIFCSSWAGLSLRACSLSQASTSLHDFFNAGASTTTEAAPSTTDSPGLSQCQPSAVPMTPSCLQNQHHLGDSYTTKFSTNRRHNNGSFGNRVYVC